MSAPGLHAQSKYVESLWKLRTLEDLVEGRGELMRTSSCLADDVTTSFRPSRPTGRMNQLLCARELPHPAQHGTVALAFPEKVRGTSELLAAAASEQYAAGQRPLQIWAVHQRPWTCTAATAWHTREGTRRNRSARRHRRLHGCWSCFTTIPISRCSR